MRAPTLIVVSVVVTVSAGAVVATSYLRRSDPHEASPGGGAATSGTGTDPARGGNYYTGGFRYETARNFAEPARSAQAYRLRPGDGADVQRIAGAFGMSGQVRDEAGQLVLADGTRRVTLSGSRWTVDIGVGGLRQGAGIASAIPGGVAPAPVGPPIDSGAAERRARAVLADAGVDLSGASVTVADQRPGWTVRFIPVVGGRRTVGLDQTVSSPGDPRRLLGQGWLSEPKAVGELKLIGVAAGLRQLAAGVFAGDPPSGGIPSGPPVTRTIVAVRVVLAVIHTGKADLLPAYQFDLEDGGSVSTPAVDASARAGR